MGTIILTVFTPTFNRACLLERCYESLCRQTSRDFCWLIVDDGSTDNTRNLVDGWIKDNKIPVKYIFQENQGMHGAHNTAYKNITTDYNVCIDSDDYMPDNAVEIIINNLNEIKNNQAGLVGLDADPSGNIIGTKIPIHVSECTLTEMYQKYKVKGDKKLVYKTNIIRNYPDYPLFEGEKFVPLGYLYSLIDQDYKMKPVNEILVIVEYQPEGSTRNIFRQYMKNPRGFAFSRISAINISKGFDLRFRNAIHLVSSAIFAGKPELLRKCKRPLFVLLAMPFGILLNIYIRIKVGFN